jgi:hypothetical protein
LKRNGGSAAVAGEGDVVKRSRGKTNSKVDEKRDAASFALQETLQGMMTQKEVRNEKKRQEKEEQMRAYMELQTKKLDMEKAAKRRKLDIETTNADTKEKRWR